MSTQFRYQDPMDTRRLIIAMLLMGVGLLAWHFIYEYPRQQAAQLKAMKEASLKQEQQALLEEKQQQESKLAQEQAAQAPKIEIKAAEIEGAISLQGARLNMLKLIQYRQETDKQSPPVELLKPASAPDAYFIEFGWVAKNTGIALPDSNTQWQIAGGNATLTPKSPVTLFWQNGQGLRFELEISLKDQYLFAINQRIVNEGDTAVTLLPYGYINRILPAESSHNVILHEGPLGVLDGSLNEVSYQTLIEEQKVTQQQASGWLGITDKYWLTALIPQADQHFTGNFKAYPAKNGGHRFQADFLGKAIEIAPGATASYNSMVFAGAKKLKLLDDYAQKYHIPLFDRAVDLGFLYFLTKPLFWLLHSLYVIAGDFGLAILLLTVIVKMAMYPLANKSFVSMNEMKRLQPKLAQLKERCGDDKMKFNQEMMKLYKQEKINPAAGCLPMVIQMPVFFALYKVLYVTIEMRHANFYGIIRDLSAPDPTNIFTLFGLLEWNPPSVMHLGILAILFAISMWAQQQMNPKPNDPAQAKVMAWLPWIFMFIMAGFPAGLLIYWIWSNIISIAQQWSIKARYSRREKKRSAAIAANDV